jgi:hypothetical protein
LSRSGLAGKLEHNTPSVVSDFTGQKNFMRLTFFATFAISLRPLRLKAFDHKGRKERKEKQARDFKAVHSSRCFIIARHL